MATPTWIPTLWSVPRGITIFSKQARFPAGGLSVTLLDTPGHVDFSPEAERVMPVLDYAILLISGTDGVQAHAETLWQLLRRYHVPTFLFLNKMDLPGADRLRLLADAKANLSEFCADMSDVESIALTSEPLLEQYLSQNRLDDALIAEAIRRERLFPCYFGSALKLEGVDQLLEALERFVAPAVYPPDFGARVYKIARDPQGNRLTFLKVTGGCLRVRGTLSYIPRGGEPLSEKVTQLRLYSGGGFQTVDEVAAGGVCAVLGPSRPAGRRCAGGGSTSGAGAAQSGDDLPPSAAPGRRAADGPAKAAPARGGRTAASHRVGRASAGNPRATHGRGAA